MKKLNLFANLEKLKSGDNIFKVEPFVFPNTGFVSSNYTHHSVVDVVPTDDYELLVTFNNGKKKNYNFRPNLSLPAFASLSNLDLFKRATVKWDFVAWNDELDISSDELYINGTLLDN